MRHRLYFHIVWTTRGRAPLINLRTAEFLMGYLRSVASAERARVLEVGIVTTHLHAIATLHPSAQVPRLLQKWKGGSAYAVNKMRLAHPAELRWADGYTIETFGHRSLEDVRRYVRSQPEHHPADAIPGWRPSPLAEELR
jgi:putative transposase